jgi:hypothetical protein
MTARDVAERAIRERGYLVVGFLKPVPLGHVFTEVADCEQKIGGFGQSMVVVTETEIGDMQEQCETLGLRSFPPLANAYYYRAVTD